MSPLSRTLALTEQLIARRSVTPEDGGCQSLVAQLLQDSGFECHPLPSGPAESRVQNLWALRRGSRASGPLLVLAAHTDVVPAGPLAQWTSDPFVPTHRGGHLFGRGAADMKTSLAAMVVAAQEFAQTHPQALGSLALLLTSDEEGVAVDGTLRVCQWLAAQGIKPHYCIVGEPTSVEQLGDMIKNGRRGTLSGRLQVNGVQGHIAYPHLARNPIHLALPALAELVSLEWDRGNAYFPPTSFQISNMHAGTGATNVIAGTALIDFNFRFSTESSEASLKERVHAVLHRHQLPFELAWTLGGEPFLTPVGTLSVALSESIVEHTGLSPALSTTGGTSDGRFIAKICPQVIEFGPVNASIHKVDENVAVASIEPLKNIYRSTLERLLT
ncbi:MAG: succinyl-diaminopimelate desuccinylase [Burkholderiaceae bacterium]